MPKTFTAPFAQSKNTGVTAGCILTAANTNYDSPTAAVLLFTAGPEGSEVSRISAMPRATATANKLQLYRSKDGGASKLYCGGALMAAYTMAATTATPVTDFGIDPAAPLFLAPGEQLYAASGVALAAGIVVTVEGEDF